MIKRIFIDAGHSSDDPGAVFNDNREADINRAIRDVVIPLLKAQGFEVFSVPDELDLKNSIKWVNNIAKNLNDGLSLAIHCNVGGGEGAESFYYAGDEKSRVLVEKFQNRFCEVTGMRNRGAKPDTQSAAGKLAWVRNTNTWAVLIEVGFIDNNYDLQKIKNYQKMASGIAEGISNIYGISYMQPESKKPMLLDLVESIQQKVEELKNEIQKLP